MKLRTISPSEAIGKLLCHNLSDQAGHKVFRKGHRVQDMDVPRLIELGLHAVYVAELEPGDVHEDEAAMRLATTVMGPGVKLSSATTGRVNLLATQRGIVCVDREVLYKVNSIAGLTIATLRSHSVVSPDTIVATVKVIPFAVPEADLRRAEALSSSTKGVVGVMPLRQLDVGVILTGSEPARARVFRLFEPPIRARIEGLGARVQAVAYVPEDPREIAAAIERQIAAGAGMVVLAGETSIMDVDDITPRGIRLAGGQVEHYGAPVEPGNLLLLAYHDHIPILGAPGCVRSRETNVVDLLLPRLLAGERVRSADIVALGDGGLMVQEHHA